MFSKFAKFSFLSLSVPVRGRQMHIPQNPISTSGNVFHWCTVCYLDLQLDHDLFGSGLDSARAGTD